MKDWNFTLQLSHSQRTKATKVNFKTSLLLQRWLRSKISKQKKTPPPKNEIPDKTKANHTNSQRTFKIPRTSNIFHPRRTAHNKSRIQPFLSPTQSPTLGRRDPIKTTNPAQHRDSNFALGSGRGGDTPNHKFIICSLQLALPCPRRGDWDEY